LVSKQIACDKRNISFCLLRRASHVVTKGNTTQTR